MMNTSGDVQDGSDECFDVVFVTAEDAETERSHHHQQTADYHRR